MTRWRLDIAYDGANFSGWATQPDRRTVQGSWKRGFPAYSVSTSPLP